MKEKLQNLDKNLIRNPLGIIGLFLVLVEAIAAFVIVRSTLSETLNAILIVFLVAFPCMVLFVFHNLVTKHHEKLYSPSDFKDEANFVKTYNSATRKIEFVEEHEPKNIIPIAQTESNMDVDGFTVSVNDELTEGGISLVEDKSEAIWLGANVPFEIAHEVITLAKSLFPHLKYIELSDIYSSDYGYMKDDIYIGGSSNTANEKQL